MYAATTKDEGNAAVGIFQQPADRVFMVYYNRKALKSEAPPCFSTRHLHSFGETRRSTSTYAEASVDTLFAFIPVVPDGAFCEGG
jgi:hypothetical protein